MLFTRALILATVLCTLSLKSFAHGGHDPRIKVSVSEEEIWFETSLPGEMLKTFDKNFDGKIVVAEYEEQFEDISVWIDKKVKLVSSGNTTAVNAYFADAPIIGRARMTQTDTVEHFKVLRRYKIRDKHQWHKLMLTISFDEAPDFFYTRTGNLDHTFKFSICLPRNVMAKLLKCNSLF